MGAPVPDDPFLVVRQDETAAQLNPQVGDVYRKELLSTIFASPPGESRIDG